jgi:hypothetical protein
VAPLDDLATSQRGIQRLMAAVLADPPVDPLVCVEQVHRMSWDLALYCLDDA